MATENLEKIGPQESFYLRPSADTVTAEWTPDSGSVHFNRVNDVVIQPTAPGVSDNYLDSNLVGIGTHTDELEIQTGTINRISSMKLWVYGETTALSVVSADVFLGGAYGGFQNIIPALSAAGWFSLTFSGSYTQTDLDALKIKIKNTTTGAGEAKVYAIYVEVIGYKYVTPCVIATDTTKVANTALKAQGWTVTTDGSNVPSSGLAI